MGTGRKAKIFINYKFHDLVDVLEKNDRMNRDDV